MICAVCNEHEAVEGCGFDNDVCERCHNFMGNFNYDPELINRAMEFQKTHVKACDDPNCNVWYKTGVHDEKDQEDYEEDYEEEDEEDYFDEEDFPRFLHTDTVIRQYITEIMNTSSRKKRDHLISELAVYYQRYDKFPGVHHFIPCLYDHENVTVVLEENIPGFQNLDYRLQFRLDGERLTKLDRYVESCPGKTYQETMLELLDQLEARR